MRRIPVGVIGCGLMGEVHINGYLRSHKAEVVGIFDVNILRAKEVSQKYSIPYFNTIDELLDVKGLEAVSICTSDDSHLEPTVRACAKGVHVLLEKPIATSLEDADAIIEHSHKAGIILMIGHIVRFVPQYESARGIAAGDELGDIISIFCRRMGNIDVQDILKGRVSVLSFLGVHDFDYALWVSGRKPIRVYSAATRKHFISKGMNIEDNAFTTITFDDNSIACIESGWMLPRNMPRKVLFQVEIIGTKGCALVDLTEQGLQICKEEAGYDRPPFNGINEIIGFELDHFLDCIMHGKTPLITGEDGRNALQIALAAQQSIKENREIIL